MQEMQVRSLGREEPLEKELAAHSNILIWRIPWTEEPGRLQSMGSLRVVCNWAHTHTRTRYSHSYQESQNGFQKDLKYIIILLKIATSFEMVSLSLSADFLFKRNNSAGLMARALGWAGLCVWSFCPRKNRLVQSVLWLLCWCESLCLWTETSGL